MAAEKKPKAVKLGRAMLHPHTGLVEFSGDRVPESIEYDFWRICDRPITLIMSPTEGGHLGTLLWQPDPPKPKTKRGRDERS